MKGVLLAGGSGKRLHPLTKVISKQLLPIYDKPMIYYPLATLVQAGIKEIALISTPHDLPLFKGLLGSGDEWGVSVTYLEQPEPEGIAQAFLLAEDFLAGESACLVLGDNIFLGEPLCALMQSARAHIDANGGACMFGTEVPDPERFGVVEFDQSGQVISIEEKPVAPKSHYAIPGLYFYDGRVCEFAKQLEPSARGELEITDLNRIYLAQQQLRVALMPAEVKWLDTGTFEALLAAGCLVAGR